MFATSIVRPAGDHEKWAAIPPARRAPRNGLKNLSREWLPLRHEVTIAKRTPTRQALGDANLNTRAGVFGISREER